MAGAATIIFAREDLSIPGGIEPSGPGGSNPEAIAAHFFGLLRDSDPDVVVLDLSRANGGGIATILKIRQQSSVPILVVCDLDRPIAREYRIAGAADCIPAPIDIMALNKSLQEIIRINGQGRPKALRRASALSFAGMTFYPHRNLLNGARGSEAKLTSSESRLLFYFASNPWVLSTRREVSEVLYGNYRPNSDRALDVVINRLRRKLISLCGPAGMNLIKTEFRRGYMLVADVSTVTVPESGKIRGEAVRLSA